MENNTFNPAGPPPWFRMMVNRALEDCFLSQPAAATQYGKTSKNISDVVTSFFGRTLACVASPETLRTFQQRCPDCKLQDCTFSFFVTDFSKSALTDTQDPHNGEEKLFLIDFTRYLCAPGLPLLCIFGNAEAVEGIRKYFVNTPPPTPLHIALVRKAFKDRNFQERTRLRVSSGTPPDNASVQTDDRHQREILNTTRTMKTAAGDALIPALMIQGTSSNAGKSVLAAAFCRILLQEGYRVAPFKAQNMALNSFVTKDGGEMGRAQVVQAGACKIDPDVRMNPVLLKPSSDTGSQVILEGKPIGNMNALDYYEYKHRLWETVTGCYDSLAEEYDVIVLEGAGSPGEVNLKSHDIVNMRMAEHAAASVLLTGDIDRGGVFASFIGTLDVMEEWERGLIAGFIVNKFRGDASLLKPAFDYVYNYTGKPVIGTVPYVHDLGLPEEDSVSFKEELYRSGGSRVKGEGLAGDRITVCVIDLPHISNFTDIDPLAGEPDVDIRIVRSEKDLGLFDGLPDIIIIPGSKNVIKDLQFLKISGIADWLKECASVTTGVSGCPGNDRRLPEIVGICGGFQMLGGEINDPHHIESDSEHIRGLGLLPVTTVLAKGKTLNQTRGRHLESGLSVKGYEIHHGKTEIRGGSVMIETVDETGSIGIGGVADKEKPVWGTYLHGIFDSDSFRHSFLESVRKRRGMPPLNRRSSYDLEASFDRLADVVREAVDIEEILELFGLR